MYARNGDTRIIHAGLPELALVDKEYALRPCLDCERRQVSLFNMASGWLGVVQHGYPCT